MIEVPGYTVIGEIGRGGMATVYRARQNLLEREVALKILSPQLTRSEAHAERFLQEARLLAALEHPNIVRVFDVGVTPDGLHYFSMQLLPGGDLGHRLSEGMSEAALVRALVAVGQALGFAHRRGYVHRDVTPANILFDLHGEPVLTDFGIARVMSAPSRLTPTGLSVGTCRYMSPEQAQGGEVDARSDLYSLGIVVYEALVGHTPFEGKDAFSIAMAHVTDPVPPLPEECAAWQPLVDALLAKDPAARLPDAAAFLDLLAEVAPEHFPEAPRADDGRLPGRRRRRLAPARWWRTARRRAARAWRALATRGSALPGGIRLALVAVPGVVLLLAAAFALWPSGPGPEEGSDASEPDRVQVAPTRREPATSRGQEDERPVEGSLASTLAGHAETAQAIVLDELPTVRDPVPVLLAQARRDIAGRRLTVPPGDSALDRLRWVLAIEPGNDQAGLGVLAVAEAYLALADERDPETDVAGWLEMLDKAVEVAALHPAAAPAAREAAARRAARVRDLLGRAGVAEEAWKAEEAIADYRRALEIQPGLDQAEQGIARAGRIGKPGFGFRDAMARGGEGPPMVVVSAGLALARTETTRGQFEAWWVAEGAGRFGGGAWPGCRDGEGFGLFRTSKRRTWQEPGFAQDASHPVVCVTPLMAESYAGWLSAQTGRRYRLPSAAEWQAAAGALDPSCGTANLRDQAHRREHGGREGLACDDGWASTAPAGGFAARGAGLYDLAGNVREWVADCGARGCDERRALGGAWSEEGTEAAELAADVGFTSVGFRLLREID